MMTLTHRRRHSNSAGSPEPLLLTTTKENEHDPIVRPKSTPVDERPSQRRRVEKDDFESKEEENRGLAVTVDRQVPAPPASYVVVGRGTGVGSVTQRRLYVILEQACLETYRVGGSKSGSRATGKGETNVKYTLLNCDDHQGILAKTGRDIADARPDIPHQVRAVRVLLICSLLNPPPGSQMMRFSVPAHPFRFAAKQSWLATGICAYHKRCLD